MSIEQLLKENTAALLALTEALKTQNTPAPQKAKAATAQAKEEVKKTSLPAEEKPAVVQESKPETKPQTTAAPDYDAASKAVMSVVKSAGKQAAIDLLAEFGAKTAKDVPVERYGELIAKAQELQGAAQ